MSVMLRPLAGFSVNISISESEDTTEHGFPEWQVTRVTLQIVSALFGQGAVLVFGHDWRDDGVMEAVHGFAREMQPPMPLTPADVAVAGQPLLRNVLPWPEKPRLEPDDIERLASTLRIETAGLPTGLTAYENTAVDWSSDLFRYVRARGLTHLRRRLNAVSQARLCLGGRMAGSEGRYPGVVEEAFLALQDHKPLYLSALLGGAASQLIDAISEKNVPANFCPPSPVSELYVRPPIFEQDPATYQDRLINRTQVWEAFAQAGRATLASFNGLSIVENEELFFTPALDRVVSLVLTGLSRLRNSAQC